MKPLARFFWLFALFAGALAAREGRAQIGYTASSIEWLTGSSDMVLRASVASLSFRAVPPPSGEEPRWRQVTVTLRVHETLKGRRAGPVVLVLRRPAEETALVRWEQSRRPLLWFLTRSSGNDRAPAADAEATGSVWNLAAPLPGGLPALELGPRAGEVRVPAPVFSMDLTLLDRAPELLAAVRADARRRRNRRPAEYRHVTLPRDVMQRMGRSGDANALVVPVDERLERLGLRWLGAEEDWVGEAGVGALEPFPSSMNVALAKRLLTDPSSRVEWTYGPENTILRGERVYYLRPAAYRLLTGWGVEVPPPTFRTSVAERLP